MSIRMRLFAAVIAAAAVPLLLVFGIVGVLLPSEVGGSEDRRLGQVATGAASLLRRDCADVGERAAVVVARLQAEVSASEQDLLPVAALRASAARVARDAVADGDPWRVWVLEGAEGADVAGSSEPGTAADPSAYLDLLCREGLLTTASGEHVLAATLPVLFQPDGSAGPETVGRVLVVAPLDDGAADRLATSLGITSSALVVSDADGEVVARSSGLADVPDEVVQGVASGEGLDADRRGQVGDRRYVQSADVLAGSARLSAVGAPAPTVSRGLVIAFVVSVFGTALLVWLISATILAPLRELDDLARRIAAGEDATEETPDASELRGVSTVLGSLARDLRAREADAQRQQGVFLDAFSRFGDALQQTHDRDGLLQTVLQAALLAAEAPMGVALHHDRGSRLGRRVLSLRERSRDERPSELDEPLRSHLTRLADRALAEQSVLEEPGDDQVGPVLAVPLGSDTRPLGAVVVAREPGAPGYDAVAFEAIGALAGNAGTALANIKDHLEVERLSVTDPLTGVHNFRHLSTMLARELERAVRFGHPLGVLMIDIDRFKAVNDTYGHAAGDAVLRELARRVAECVREVDTVARYGGEEFALLLPETDLEGASALAERILAALRAEPFRLPDGQPDLPVTASVGIAAYPQHGTTGADIMRAADRALYEAKEQGRDRAHVARAPGGEHGSTVGAGARE